jgi:hypothetical protein
MGFLNLDPGAVFLIVSFLVLSVMALLSSWLCGKFGFRVKNKTIHGIKR